MVATSKQDRRPVGLPNRPRHDSAAVDDDHRFQYWERTKTDRKAVEKSDFD